MKFSYRRTNWSQAVTYFRSATDTRKTLDSICEEKLNVCRFTFVQVKKQGKLYCLDRFSGYFPPANWLHTPELQRYYFCSRKLRADQIERLEQMTRAVVVWRNIKLQQHWLYPHVAYDLGMRMRNLIELSADRINLGWRNTAMTFRGIGGVICILQGNTCEWNGKT